VCLSAGLRVLVALEPRQCRALQCGFNNAQQIIRDVFNLGANSSLEKAITENDLMDITDWMLLTVQI
jgi:hypothetical protein